MPGRDGRITREGLVVERDGVSVVRFGTGCGAAGQCACVPGHRDVVPAVLGLDAALPAGGRVTVSMTAAALERLGLRLFALPLVALLLGAGLGRLLGAGSAGGADAWSAGLGLAALAATLLAVIRRSGAQVPSLEVNAHPGASQQTHPQARVHLPGHPRLPRTES